MKKIFTTAILLLLVFSLILSVTAEEVDMSSYAEYIDFLKDSRSRVFGELYDMVNVMNSFMLYNRYDEIMTSMLSNPDEHDFLRTYGEGASIHDEEFISLFGFREYYGSDLFDEWPERLSKSYSGIQIETLVSWGGIDLPDTTYTTGFNIVAHSIVIDNDSFDLLNSDLKEYLSNFETLEDFFEYMGSDGETLAFTYNGEVTSGDYIYWGCPLTTDNRPRTYDEWVSDLESGEKYYPDLDGARDGFSIFTDLSSVCFVYKYDMDQLHSPISIVPSNAYYMTLEYGDPAEGDDADDYSARKLESVKFYAELNYMFLDFPYDYIPCFETDIETVEETSVETEVSGGTTSGDTENPASPQTGDGIMTAAIAGSAAAIAALAVYLRRKMR